MSHQVHEMSQSFVFLPYNERPPCSVYFFLPNSFSRQPILHALSNLESIISRLLLAKSL